MKKIRNQHKVKFYVFISTLISIIIVLGFSQYFSSLFRHDLKSPLFIHMHVLLFFFWVFFYTTQALLPAFGRVDLHKKLGKFSIPITLLIVIDGLYVTFERLNIRVENGNIEGARLFLLQPLTDMIIFPMIVFTALLYRKKREIHKRLMLLATLFISIAAVVRLDFGIPGLNLLTWISPIMIAIIYDYYTKKVIHPVYIIGAVLFVAVYLRTKLLWHTPLWNNISNSIIEMTS
ncbi:hypothetical protein [Paraglaciecola sp. 2405UD69-4]|uniref:hypothetical protein n=1 Tax=Paraglaciecola sp. 2405UD69-4 TaxID=3391836 RepID=UPI0039C95574